MSAHEGFYHYPPVDDRAMQWGVYVTSAGRGIVRPGQPYPSQGHPQLYEFHWNQGRTLPEFQAILITDGSGEFESRETGRRLIAPGSLLILFPGVWHRYRPDPKTGWKERWIGFHGEMTHRLLSLGVLRPDRPLREVPCTCDLVASFDRLLEQIHEDPLQDAISLSMQAMSLLAIVVQRASENDLPAGAQHHLAPAAVADELVRQAVELIWTHSHRQISVQAIARQLPVTRRTLDRRFRAVLGRSVLEEITRCRLSRAERLLTETNLAVKTVAHLAGFPTAERMRLAFLQQGLGTPSRFRTAKSD